MPEFLNTEDVLSIHAEQLELFGGLAGLRDPSLLESALAQPIATFGGEFLHENLFAMGAAYLFHIVKNHPFLDGNKRTGYICALTFLAINGVTIDQPNPLLYDATMSVAEGRLDKSGLEALLRQIATSPQED
ncbi:MAG TPA: type II toxin-antitoxin system death-on-curing family toxin [Isosphaeraceae bacterium]|jgi:death-on-curing protein|nr:type II toxin-antitoxin system death-on-curing family toxin [Isosphaeraceae bacterium]